MNIPLNQFEQMIDETILKRGFSYFKNGAINNFTELSKGEYEATIEGTDEYTVYIKVKKHVVTEHQCDCPYDLGPVCKHIVAAIFYLQQDELQLIENSPKKTQNKKTKSVKQQIKEYLQAISHQELIEFVQENATKDPKFRNLFLTSFNHLNQEQSKEFYQKLIQSILKTAKSRNGWIEWSQMKYVKNAMQPFVDKANKYVVNKNFENAFFISIALVEEMTETLQYADDSNGDIGYFVESSMDLLREIAKENNNEKLKQEIFTYCISTFQKGLFKGWDWHLDLISIAIDLTDNEKDANTILKSIEIVSSEYEKEIAQLYKLQLLKRFKSKKEVDEFINAHIANYSIRMSEIEIAFENKDFERVIKLSKDGIKCDEKNKPGLVKHWYNWLLKVAQYQKDTAKIIEYARFLFIDNFHPEQDYYQILKQTIENERWNTFLEELIKDITPKNNWTYNELIRKIYITEQWWDRLFAMLKQNCSLENIQKNESYLTKDYQNELIEMYKEKLLVYLENFIGRNHYVKACTYLRQMKKIGGNEEAEALVEIFRKKYPQRKALLDELNLV
jgi:hypothetical protein